MNNLGHAGRTLSSAGRVQRSWRARRIARERVAAALVAIASLVGAAAAVLAARRPPPAADGGVAVDSRAASRSRGLHAGSRPFLETALILEGLALQYVANESGARPPAVTRPESVSLGSDFASERRAVEQVGHRILRTLCGTPSDSGPGAEPADLWAAFERGWVAHFVALACDSPQSPVQALEEEGRDLAAFDYWSQRLDRERRTRAGAASLLYPLWTARYSWAASVRTVRRGIPAARAREDTPPQPIDVVLDGDIVGSVLYSLVTDPRIQATYRPAAFYSRFVPPTGPARGGLPNRRESVSPAEAFSPLENAYLKVFHVLARSVRPGSAASRRPPIITLVDEYAKQFPDEAEPACDVFLAATEGLTVDPDLARYWPANGGPRGAWAEEHYRARLRVLRDELARGLVAPDAALRTTPGATVAISPDEAHGWSGAHYRAAATPPRGGPFYPFPEVLRTLARRIALAMTAAGLAAVASAAGSRAVASRTPRPIVIVVIALSAFLLAA